MAVPFLDLKLQYQALQTELETALLAAARSTQYIMGPNVPAFESEIAAYLGVKHAIGCASGTDALLLSLMALDLGPGDEVITTPFTFFATVGCIVRLGATPVFVDVDPVTFNLDVSKVAERVTKRTKAIIPVHLFGLPVDMAPLQALAKAHGFAVVEDCAQSLGSSDRGVKTGAIGDTGCISFFPTKNLGGFGDGGMVVTQRDDLAGKIRMLRVHGAKPKYFHKLVGLNSRLDDVQAAVLRVKLPHLDAWNRGRMEKATRYDRLLADLPLVLPTRRDEAVHIFHQYAVRVGGGARDRVLREMNDKKIGAGVYYPLSLHLQECFSDLAYKRGDMPGSEQVETEILSLPIYPEMTDAQQEEVAAVLRSALAGARGAGAQA